MSKHQAKAVRKTVARNAVNNLTKKENDTMTTKMNDAKYDAMVAHAEKLAEEMKVSWVDDSVRKAMAVKFPELKAANGNRTPEVAKYIKADSAGRAWVSRKKLFGPSGYKNRYWEGRATKKAAKPGPFDFSD